MVQKTVWRSALSVLVGLSGVYAPMAALHSEISVTSNLGPHVPPKFEIGDCTMNYDMKRSGAYIQKLRIQNGYTQNEFAKALNTNQSFLSRIEAGQKGCSVDMFIQLSEFFHVSLDALILGMEPDVALEAERKERMKADITEVIDKLTQLKAQL